MPEMNELHRAYADQGLVLIGVHTKGSADRMAAYVEENDVAFPVCVDAEERTVGAYRVDSFPDYYLIDRWGRLRVADLANDAVVPAVEALLAERVVVGPQLADWRGDSYAYVHEGERTGSWTLANALVEHEGEPAFRFVDELALDFLGDRIEARYEVLCAIDEDLTPLRIRGRFASGGETAATQVARVVAPDGTAVLVGEHEGERVELRLPARTVPDYALFRLVTRMPFEEGVGRGLDVLEVSELRLRRGEEIVCAGEEELVVGGAPQRVWRFDHTGPAIRPIRYWVDGERRLVRVDLGGKELRLATDAR